MKRILATVIFVAAILCVILFGFPLVAKTEEAEPVRLYVTANVLNGRARPSKRSTVEARFDKEDALKAYGWSKSHHWIEVDGGETGRVWIFWEYVTERTEDSRWINDGRKKVKIRKEPFGTVTGYLKPGKEIVVDRIVLGWGHCRRGWVYLENLIEEL